ncbi:peptide/nickel transport system permease protein [Psychrobacillus insolitus]|uniref:Peptide/nickel transport system permease protein n=1 Tax=Psychrobacillus insolitus TaxID=1461 RepID=A0A2W7MNU5_9BACI|nr:ABC transporter permease [Psychrobacillus insolitus]PZX03953.1 peptide/nickel transport system permease protein [Psychrobacillus insolitus]
MNSTLSSFGKKLLQYGLVLLVALTINFALPRLAPGDPLLYFFGDTINELTEVQKQQALESMGLGGSLWEQYIEYLKGIVTFDFGMSIKYAEPVMTIIGDRLPWTLLLVGPAMLFSAVIGVILGAYSAWNRGKSRDVSLLVGMLTLQAVPGFWVGLLFLAILAVQLGWFPTYGAVSMMQDGSVWGYIKDVAMHAVLPLTTITLATVGSNYLLTRSSMLESLGQDYITMAEAKGVHKKGLIFNHALRNALLPIYTHFTMTLGTLVGGAVVVESVFSYPGIGRLLYESVIARDFPMMQGIFLIITLGVIGANLFADLTYPLVDPRARTLKKIKGADMNHA